MKRFVFFLALLSASSAFAAELRVLTFNTWLLPGVSDNYLSRLEQMPRLLASTRADIIGLQEVWRDKARDDLIAGMRSQGYAYSAYTQSELERYEIAPLRGHLGNGLLVFSKFPIVADSFRSMEFTDFTRADEYFAHKGAIRIAVEVPGLGTVDVYDSHVGAVSFDPKTQSYDHNEERTRHGQVEELRRFIQSTRQHSVLFLTVDMNAHPLVWDESKRAFDPQRFSADYRTLTEDLGLTDATRAMNRRGVTWDMKNNPAAQQGVFGGIPSEAVDYTFVGGAQIFRRILPFVVFNWPMVYPKMWGDPIYLSDHYGVLTRFEY